ncbi:hypothetical protein, partial [Enterococcus faecium]|uniref:hypothetical protein n=1 Tax=Enterococcus faecium TaxID=1352 RepID=UPI003F441BBB
MSVLLIYSCFEGVRYIIEYSGFVYVHYTEKLLVSKKSEDKHGKLPWKSEICEKSLYIKDFFFFLYHIFNMFWAFFSNVLSNCPESPNIDYYYRQNTEKISSHFDDKFNTKNT